MTLQEQITQSKASIAKITGDIGIYEEQLKNEKSKLKKLEKELDRRTKFEQEVAIYKPKMETR